MIEKQNMQTHTNRRHFLKLSAAFALMTATPVFAFDLFKAIDPKGKNKDLLKAKQIFKGASKIISSTEDIDFKSEYAIGESLALEGFKRFGMPVPNKELQRYVNLVGNTVARYSKRPEIPYHFVMIQSNIYNAFACPGGIIFVSSELVRSMADEAELAGVLAHEVAHISHKHALKSIQRAKFFEGVGEVSTVNMQGDKGQKFRSMIGDLQNVLFDKGLDKNMEFEADLSGIECAYKTGYNPMGLVRVLQMLEQKESKAQKKGSWFSTHPPLPDRIQRCNQKEKSFPDRMELAIVKDRFLHYQKMI